MPQLSPLPWVISFIVIVMLVVFMLIVYFMKFENLVNFNGGGVKLMKWYW
uniref:ATP synthase F0 subunit 8 n=1 Tax=Austrarchaea sp. VIC_1 TaxID=1090239 RepID=H2E4E0_9ARAC|nr:ATP synthase F0 subunit 8 [Austrarchaea sp. VIC_1]AEX89052.1 ATP synthase F0 subunit 8 [Austrarchaea sp. VIC_1]AEX89055.1 ATP synthase F0 subunit 8 [Austrarchaea sp. VIC_1]